MTKKVFVLALIFVIFLVSCSKKNEFYTKEVNGHKVYVSPNKPKNTSFVIDTTAVFTIKSLFKDSLLFNSVEDIESDKDGNIYVLDSRECMIVKFDNNGKFIKKIGRKGNGPGEFKYSYNFSICNDTLMVLDGERHFLVKFSLDGEFIGNLKLSEVTLPTAELYTIDDSYLACISTIFYEKEKWFQIEKLALLSDKFEEKRTVFDQKRDFNPKLMDMDRTWLRFCSDGEKIYFSPTSEDKYIINVYDKNGILDHSIQKKYRKIKYTKKEMERYRKTHHYMFSATEEIIQSKMSTEYKKSISDIEVDKYKRLWVILPSLYDDTIAEIFVENQFDSRIKLNFQPRFVGDYIVNIDSKNNEIKFYKY